MSGSEDVPSGTALNSPPSSSPSSTHSLRARTSSFVTDEVGVAEAAIPRFSKQLESTLKEVFPSEDPLQQTEFDPIQYINSTFPNEESLVGGKLDVFLVSLRRRVGTLQESITRDVREHSQTRSHTTKAIQSASGSIGDLFNKISLIRSKAHESEIMVQEICRDIRSLDTAKKHLINTIRALRNLHMLVSAVGQLDAMVSEKQYKLAAERLRAIQDLFTLFEAYGDVPKIRSLRASVESTKTLMKEQLTAEFHKVLPSPLVAQEPQCSLMSDACLVVDVIDMHFKSDLLNWFSSLQLDEYAAVFSLGKDGATIEQIERRYTWMKSWFRMYEQRYSKVFPPHWYVPVFLSKEFCTMTRMHIHKILQLNQGKFDVQVMINSLLATIDFEKSLNAKFKSYLTGGANAKAAAAATAAAEALEEDAEVAHDTLVEQIKAKYKKQTDSEKAAAEERKRQDELAAERAAAMGLSGKQAGPQQPPMVTDFVGMISECFTPYMQGYIEMERKNMADLIQQFDRDEAWSNPEDPNRKNIVADRFGSSNDIFQYIKSSFTRCSKMNKNVTLFNLYEEYRTALSAYCNLLDSKLPKKAEGQSLTPNEIILSCFIINTCEYIMETLPGLCERISVIIDADYKEKINFDTQVEEFEKCIVKSVNVLNSNMWNKLNKVLLGMTRLPWSTWTSVGDESSYVAQTYLIFKEELPVISSKLSSRYWTQMCNTIATTFVPRYVDSIYKCKRIGEMGAQQMSLDAHALKNVLLNVPNIAGPITASSSSSDSKFAHTPTAAAAAAAAARPVNKTFQRYVNTEMGKAEALIKTLVSPNERLIVTFKALLPKSNVDDLMSIMNLRGLKRTEQEALVNAYNTTVGPEDQLKLKTENNAKFTSIFSQLRSS